MNLRKKKELLTLLKQYKRSSRGRLKQYTVEDLDHHENLHKDISYFENVGIDKIFKPIIKLIENKMKPLNGILKFDLKIENKNVSDYYIVNKYYDYNDKIVNNLNLSDKEKSAIIWKLIALNRTEIIVDYGWKNVTPYVYVAAPQGNREYDFEESKSKKLVADVQKFLMKGVNDTLNDIIKLVKK